MQADYEVYLDPEEDEVFFGCVSEKEKNRYGQLVKSTESTSLSDNKKLEQESEKLNSILQAENQCVANNENNESKRLNLVQEKSHANHNNICEIVIEDSETSPQEKWDLYCKSQDINIIYSNNVSVELDHNYSTPTKHKIDKTILSTPKSVVKADKDGGFLKVLSEIALVKAEAEADKKAIGTGEKDEDKENKMIPEIKIIESTPDHKNKKSRSHSDLSEFGIIHDSSNKEKNLDCEKLPKSKSPGKISKKKCLKLNGDENFTFNNKDVENATNVNENLCNQSIKLIEFNNSCLLTKSSPVEDSKEYELLEILEIGQSSNRRNDFVLPQESQMTFSSSKNEMVCRSKTVEGDCGRNADFCVSKSPMILISHENEVLREDNKEVEENCFISRDEELVDGLLNINEKIQQGEINKGGVITVAALEQHKTESDSNSIKEITQKLNCPSETYETFPLPENLQMVTDTDEIQFESYKGQGKSDVVKEIDRPPSNSTPEISKNFARFENVETTAASEKKEGVFKEPPVAENDRRFSKEAKKIVEMLKKSTTVDDTIQEIDVENLEDTFLFPTTDSCFDKPASLGGGVETQEPPAKKSPKMPAKPLDSTIEKLSKTLEKDSRTPSQLPSRSKIQLTYLSENRIYNQKQTVKKCVKKLPLEGNKSATSEEKATDGKAEKEGPRQPLSRIPMFGSKVTKLGANEPKTKAVKTPTGYKARNFKFHHIESPISAYIHNKPTVLVKNAKPEGKKELLGKEWKSRSGDAPKRPQQRAEAERTKDVAFPYVVYKSASPFVVKKQPESRLPRLVSTVRNLIGSDSPQMLKHEGRFFLKTPSKLADANSTVMAAPNEVSLIVSQTAKKTK